MIDMKRKKDDEMVQTAVRLPQSLRDRLSKTGGERGLGDEIRRRLEASFEAERAPADPKTGELLAAIAFCAADIARDYGLWSEDAFAFEVLKGCMNMLLKHFRPRGEPVPNPNPNGLAALLFDQRSATPEVLSRHYVHFWMSDRARRADEEKRR
jgi:hypothetical protein